MQCRKTDWRENFREKSKAPFGTYIIHNEIEDLLESDAKVDLKQNIYDYLYESDSAYLNNEKTATYVCIKSYPKNLYADYSVESLLEFVSAGNTVFMAFNYYSAALKDTLKFKTTNLDSTAFKPETLKSLKGDLILQNNTTDSVFNFDRNLRRNYFSEFPKNSTVVLGTQKIDSLNQPVFIKMYFGDGTFYLHTQPSVFTNYNLLNGKHDYTEAVFSYLPNKDEVLWDSQKSSLLNPKNRGPKESVFSFFLKHDSLKWSLFTLFTGLILFLLFNAKRKQRVIPVISKLKNSTVEFAHTISNLYLKEENHKNMADKKIRYFLEYIRTKYLLNTSNLNSTFKERLAQKSGNSFQHTNFLINTIIELNKRHTCTESELIRLNSSIEKFLNQK